MALLTLRPNGAGTYTSIASQYPATGNHWDKVDDETPDDGATIVYTTFSGYQTDCFVFPNQSDIGPINSVSVYVVCDKESSGGGYLCTPIIFIAPSWYGTDQTLADGGYSEYHQTWTTNPATSSSWEWSDLDSAEIGVRLRGLGDYEVRCTQVYVVIDYTPYPSGGEGQIIGLEI